MKHRSYTSDLEIYHAKVHKEGSLMKNPWAEMSQEFPFLLPSDYRSVMAFNRLVEEIHKLRYELLPEPFLGKPDADIFLLNLNPGYSDLDLPFYEKECVQTMWQKNILHEPQPYPFYLLDPAIADESGPQWWAQKMKEPIRLAGRKTVANTFCCVEYFPYHSKRFRLNKEILESQRYSFHLVQAAIHRDCPIILMRGEKFWLDAVPPLASYQKLYRLNSAQNVSISRNNCPEGFAVIEKILLSQREAHETA